MGRVVSENVKQKITEHHRQLQNSLEEYFPPNNNDSNWLRNPVSRSIQKEDFSFNENDQLILSMIQFQCTSFLLFLFPVLASLTEDYPEILK